MPKWPRSGPTTRSTADKPRLEGTPAAPNGSSENLSIRSSQDHEALKQKSPKQDSSLVTACYVVCRLPIGQQQHYFPARSNAAKTIPGVSASGNTIGGSCAFFG